MDLATVLESVGPTLLELHLGLAAHGIVAEPDARRDVVDVLLHVGRHVVLVTGHVLVGARAVLPDIKVGEQEILNLVGRRVELDPLLPGIVHRLANATQRLPIYTGEAYLLVDRLADALTVDTGSHEPVDDGVDTGLLRSEEVNDLFGGHVLAVVRRPGGGTLD